VNNERNLQDLASSIEVEAKQFGRVLPPGRALELAKEVQRYDDAIREIAAPLGIHQEPSDFRRVLLQFTAR
jgi:hypothetical protein